MGVAGEARIGAGGVPQTVRPHRYRWVGPLQAGAGVAVEVDHAPTGVGHPAQSISRAELVGHKIPASGAKYEQLNASRWFLRV